MQMKLYCISLYVILCTKHALWSVVIQCQISRVPGLSLTVSKTLYSYCSFPEGRPDNTENCQRVHVRKAST